MGLVIFSSYIASHTFMTLPVAILMVLSAGMAYAASAEAHTLLYLAM